MPNVRYVKNGGTKTTGNSTPDDWTTASNCYSSIQTAINAASLTADAQIILDDDTFTVTSLASATSSLPTGGVLTIISRSLNPANCVINFTDGGATSLKFNEASLNYSHHIEGIKFRKTSTHTVSGGALIGLTGETSLDTEFKNCIFADVTNNYANAGLCGYVQLSDGVPRTLTFTNCTFDNLVSAHNGGRWFAYAGTSGALTFFGCAFSNIAHVSSTDTNCTGGICGAGTVNITNCTINGMDVSTASLSAAMYAFICTQGTLNVDGLTASSITFTGGASGAVGIRAEGAYTIENTEFTDCSSTPSYANGVDGDRTNSVGGTVLAFGDSAQGTLTNHKTTRCISDFGVTAYCSQGGGGTFTNITSVDCTSRKEGVLYAGGWGDVTYNRFRLISPRIGLETAGGGAVQEGFGGAIYAHNHTNSTRNKTTTIRNGLIIGAHQLNGGDAGIRLRGLVEAYSHNVEITDVIMDNPGQVSQVSLRESALCALNVSGSGIVMTDGEDGLILAKNGVGVDSYSQPTDVKYNPVRRGTVARNSVERRRV